MEISSVSQYDYGMESQNLSAFAQAIKNKQNQIILERPQEVNVYDVNKGNYTYTIPAGTRYQLAEIEEYGLNMFVPDGIPVQYALNPQSWAPQRWGQQFWKTQHYSVKDNENPIASTLNFADRAAVSSFNFNRGLNDGGYYYILILT
jgi:hypothetical protein